MFTKLMILAIPSVRVTIYRELRDLGRKITILSDCKRNIKEFKMAGDYLKRVERLGLFQIRQSIDNPEDRDWKRQLKF